MNTRKKNLAPLIPITDQRYLCTLEQALGETSISCENAPNFIRLLAHSSVALKACLQFDHLLAHGRLTPREREQIALAMAEINRCSYSLSMHCDRSRRLGLDEEEIRSARKATAADPATRTMLRFVLTFVLHRGEVSPDEFRALRMAGFSDADIVEIIANIALNIFTNYFNVAFKTQVDFPLVTPGVEKSGAACTDDPSNGKAQATKF